MNISINKIKAYLAKRNIIKMKDEDYIKLIYKNVFNKELDLEEPKTFNEKLQWLKLYDRKNIYTTMVDKYEAKQYVSNIIGKEYIIPTYDVYEKFEDIDFEKLPNQFVLKTTHDSGGLVICRDKKTFNYKKAKTKLNKDLKKNYYLNGREWPYKNVHPRIIAEKYMQNKEEKELKDYKFYCFNGKPLFLYVSEGLENHKTARISFYDIDYNEVPFSRTDYQQFEEKPKKPVNFEKMKELAEKLSKGHAFLRVDFYEINNKIYFGELTFTPNSGLMLFKPKEYDEILGNLIELPIKNR